VCGWVGERAREREDQRKCSVCVCKREKSVLCACVRQSEKERVCLCVRACV